MKHINLTIEKGKDGALWGRVNYDDNLIVDQAATVDKLKTQFKKLLKGFHEVDPKEVEFEVVYDLTTLFEFKNFLNISAIAAKAGINPSLMRQYAAGIKFPSESKTKEIEKVIHELGRELISTKLGQGASRSGRSRKQVA